MWVFIYQLLTKNYNFKSPLNLNFSPNKSTIPHPFLLLRKNLKNPPKMFQIPWDLSLWTYEGIFKLHEVNLKEIITSNARIVLKWTVLKTSYSGMIIIPPFIDTRFSVLSNEWNISNVAVINLRRINLLICSAFQLWTPPLDLISFFEPNKFIFITIQSLVRQSV